MPDLRKINKIYNPLARVNTKRRKIIQITDIRNERENITIQTMGIKRIVKEYSQ